jgi:hypothetical protein
VCLSLNVPFVPDIKLGPRDQQEAASFPPTPVEIASPPKKKTMNTRDQQKQNKTNAGKVVPPPASPHKEGLLEEVESKGGPTPITTEKRAYFTPCLLVDNEQSANTVTIRGWRIDGLMWNVFDQIMPLQTQLRTLCLWRVGIEEDSILERLALLLPTCPSLATLILDNNSLGQCSVSKLILGKQCRLKLLSLRFCEIDDVSAAGLAGALWNVDSGNQSLVTLLLTGNKIGDCGAMALAEALKVNRTLLVLNLAANAIGDEGCAHLAGALCWFPVEGPLLAARKRLIQQLWWKDVEPRRTSPPFFPKRRESNAPKKKQLTKQLSKGSKAKDKGKTVAHGHTAASSANFPKKTSKRSEPSSLPESTDPNENVEKVYVPKRFVVSNLKVPAWNGGDSPVTRALLSEGYIHQGKVWLQGNHTLIALNLLRNKITKNGLHAMAMALEEQHEKWQHIQDRANRIMEKQRKQAEAQRKAEEAQRVAELEAQQMAQRWQSDRFRKNASVLKKQFSVIDSSEKISTTEVHNLSVKKRPASSRELTAKRSHSGRSSPMLAETVSLPETQSLPELNVSIKEEVSPSPSLISIAPSPMEEPEEPMFEPSELQGLGLLRILLHMNCFDATTAPDMQRINEFMKQRENIRKIAQETASTAA